MEPLPKPALEGHLSGDSQIEWDLFWERNKSLILFVTGAVLVGSVCLAIWFVFSTSQNVAAQKLLAESSSIEALQIVVDKFPKSRCAADALMQIASLERDAGNLEKSTAAFREFLNRFPKHELAGGALLGIAMNQDASGDEKSAMTTCQQVVTQYPASYAAPFAAYTEGEILLRGLQIDDARSRFNMVVTQFPSSPAARMSASQLSRLGGPPSAQ
ncbi:MAG: tetratricopeptide repeat protein [bacterium]